MASTPRSSFIPKQVTGAIPQKVRRTRVFSLVGFVSGLMLFSAVLSAVGVFVYKEFIVSKNLASEKQALEQERNKFDETEITGVKDFDRKIELSKKLLDAHVAPSKIFDALEVRTKQSVQYTSFTYTRRPSGNVTVDLAGVTDEFAKVALQSLQYAQDVVLKDASVTSIGLGIPTNAAAASTATPTPSPSNKQISFTLVANVTASQIPFTPRGAASFSEQVNAEMPPVATDPSATTSDTQVGGEVSETIPEVPAASNVLPN